jgi:PII-like signaling protein
VTEDWLKLTAYFAERLRTPAAGVAKSGTPAKPFVADAVLDLYGRSEVATSIVLRGIASFGPHHQIRTDETLSMSEDPAVAVAAVDTADKIATLVDDVVALTARGLVTLERARLVDPRQAAEFDTPDTTKLTIYVGRQDRVSAVPAHIAVCDLLRRRGFAGASVFLGVDGTAHGARRRARFFSRNVDVPVMVIAVGTGSQVAETIAELTEVSRQPLVTVERVQLCKLDGQLLAQPAPLPATDDNGRPLWQKLMVYTSEAVLHAGLPIHRALVRRLYESEAVSGATVLRGMWGYHGDEQPHGDKLIQLGRRVPVTTVMVDTPQRIARAFEVVDELTDQHGLVTCELVPGLVSIDSGEIRGSTRLARHRY